jgi:maltooligosyltrehalose trehalohydrolase
MSQTQHRQWLRWYKTILRVRREQIVPLIDKIGGHAGQHRVLGKNAVLACWKVDHHMELTLQANLSADTLESVPNVDGRTLWTEGPVVDGNRMGPWSLRWSLRE